MKECWNEDPTQRPSFDSLFNQLQSLETELNATPHRKNTNSDDNNTQPTITTTAYQSIKESILVDEPSHSSDTEESNHNSDAEDKRNDTLYGNIKDSVMVDQSSHNSDVEQTQ